jgi:hypothetical protein
MSQRSTVVAKTELYRWTGEYEEKVEGGANAHKKKRGGSPKFTMPPRV